jgi:hypothetical protein
MILPDDRSHLRSGVRAPGGSSVADLLSGPLAIGVGGRGQHVHGSAGDLQHEQHVNPLERHRTVHLEKVAR